MAWWTAFTDTLGPLGLIIGAAITFIIGRLRTPGVDEKGARSSDEQSVITQLRKLLLEQERELTEMKQQLADFREYAYTLRRCIYEGTPPPPPPWPDKLPK